MVVDHKEEVADTDKIAVVVEDMLVDVDVVEDISQTMKKERSSQIWDEEGEIHSRGTINLQ